MSGGQLITVSQGTLTPLISLDSLLITVGQGTLTATGQDVTVNISGVEAEVLQGIVVIGPTLLTGVSTSSEQGAPTLTNEVALTGSAITASAGSVTAAQEADDTYIQSATGTATPSTDVPLTGIEITSAQESIVFSQGTLSGSEVTLSQGSVFQLVSVPLTGESITIESGTMVDSGGTAWIEPPDFGQATGGFERERGRGRGRRRLTQEERIAAARQAVGINTRAAEIIENVAVRQATAGADDALQNLEELQRELMTAGLDWESEYLRRLEARRAEIAAEIETNRLKLLQENNNRLILLLASQL